MTGFRVTGVQTGRARPFGPNGELSAIEKAARHGPVMAGPTGLEGDEQGDTRRHGGPDKAIHAYPVTHYAIWAAQLPERADRLSPGTFGENLMLDGVDEAGICLGDLWQVGGARLQVSQSRQPCWKLNLRFGLPDMARRVQESGRTGWYFRVLRQGPIAAGDTGRLIARPQADWPLDRVHRLLYRDMLDRDALRDLAALDGLPDSWRRLALARLNRGEVEDWTTRLHAPARPG